MTSPIRTFLHSTDTGDDITTPCQGDPDLWFATRPSEVAVAVAACRACPLLGPCRRATDDMISRLGLSQVWGVWAARSYIPAGQRKDRP